MLSIYQDYYIEICEYGMRIRVRVGGLMLGSYSELETYGHAMKHFCGRPGLLFQASAFVWFRDFVVCAKAWLVVWSQLCKKMFL